MTPKQNRESSVPSPGGSRRWILLGILAAGLLAIGAGLFVMYFQEDPAVKEAAVELERVRNPFLTPKAKIPRPPSLDPDQFQDPNVRAAYQVARNAPELLEQMPCYCGCFTTGHTSNYDCFVDNHGVT
jgi:hypothetical protein